MRVKNLISVIVPIYNMEKYLVRCVESLINQSYKNLEIILVNDGSTDKSGNICDEFSLRDDRIKVIHKKNGGLSDARNAGLDVALGEYVGFVDSDDYVDRNMYEILFNACNSYACKIAMCGRYNVSRKKQEQAYCMKGPEVFENDKLLAGFFEVKYFDCSSCDKLFHYSIINGLRFPKGKTSEDLPYVYKALKRANKAVHVAIPLYYYWHRDDSVTRVTFSEKRLDYIYYLEKIEKDIWKSRNRMLIGKIYVLYALIVNQYIGLLDKKKMSAKSYYKCKLILKKKAATRLFFILCNQYITTDEKKKIVKNMFA